MSTNSYWCHIRREKRTKAELTTLESHCLDNTDPNPPTEGVEWTLIIKCIDSSYPNR